MSYFSSYQVIPSGKYGLYRPREVNCGNNIPAIGMNEENYQRGRLSKCSLTYWRRIMNQISPGN
jgi:hypothetical protein